MKLVLSEISLTLAPSDSEEINVRIVRSNIISKFLELSVLGRWFKPNILRKYDGNADVVAIVGSRAMAQRALRMNLPGLRMFQLTSAGFDGIPVEEFRKKGIYLCSAGEVYSIPIAETVVYGMLQYAKRYWRNPNWQFPRIFRRRYCYIEELAGKRLLVMGIGSIGTHVATRAAAFGMDVCGYHPSATYREGYRKIYNTRDELIAHIGGFDYIAISIPLKEETRGFLDAELFSAMNKNSVIINVGRRGLFNEDEFYQALKKRRIRGAVLDMFELVPNPFSNRFRRLSNTIVWPSVAADSLAVRPRLREHVSNNVQRILDSQTPECIIK